MRDVPAPLRTRVGALAADGGAPAELARSVREVAVATADEEQRIFGESLPPGLSLVEADEADAPEPV